MLAYTRHNPTAYVHVRVGFLSNFGPSHILSFVIFVELLLFKVEIVIGRLQASSRCHRVGYKMCSEQKSAFKS